MSALADRHAQAQSQRHGGWGEEQEDVGGGTTVLSPAVARRNAWQAEIRQAGAADVIWLRGRRGARRRGESLSGEALCRAWGMSGYWPLCVLVEQGQTSRREVSEWVGGLAMVFGLWALDGVVVTHFSESCVLTAGRV